MKIGIVSQWYAPEPWCIPTSLATGLAKRGHEVRVLTGFPNYPEGRIYPGYRQRWRDQSSDRNVTIRRVPLYPSHSSSSVGRAANYLSFAATSSLASVRYLADVDALYVYHPPLTAYAAPALLRMLYGTPAVLHVQDVWPESVSASPLAPNGLLGRVLDAALDRAIRRVYRTAVGIAVIAPSMRDILAKRGADSDKVRVVLNWTDEALLAPKDHDSEGARRRIGHRGRCTIMYAGNLGPFQSIPTAIRAAAALEQSGMVDLVLVGSGIARDSAQALVRQLGADNVRFIERHSPSEMAALYSAADFQLISLADLPIFYGTIPSKLQAALCAGSPVVVSAPGDVASFVERTGVGMTCPPDNPHALAERFSQIAALSDCEKADMAQRARDVYRRHMSQRQGIDQLEQMLNHAAATRSRRS